MPQEMRTMDIYINPTIVVLEVARTNTIKAKQVIKKAAVAAQKVNICNASKRDDK